MKVLVDTNVIIDALTQRQPWVKEAEDIFMMAANYTIDMCITASEATDIYYLVRKYLHDSVKAKLSIATLFSLVHILDVNEKDCTDALVSAIDDYEDAVQEKSAVRNGIDYIITRNKKDFANSILKVVTPSEFVALV